MGASIKVASRLTVKGRKAVVETVAVAVARIETAVEVAEVAKRVPASIRRKDSNRDPMSVRP